MVRGRGRLLRTDLGESIATVSSNCELWFTQDAQVEARSLAVLGLLQSARQTYGLRTNDYSRYHSHAVRRIARLSKSTSTSTSTAKKASSKQGNSGQIKAVKLAEIDAAAIQRDERLLELLLWEAERAWAEGMRTREELAAMSQSQAQASRASQASATQGLARKRHRSQRRLAKATAHADRLAQLLASMLMLEGSQPSVTASTVLQATIYRNIIAGTYAFSLASANSAGSSSSNSNGSGVSPAANGAKYFATAYVLLEAFAKQSNRANDEALAFELLDELEPMLRFCAYKAELSAGSSVAETARKIGSAALNDNEGLAKLVSMHEREEAATITAGIKGSKAKQRDQANVKQIKWRDIDIQVKSAELSSALGKVHHALAQLQKSDSASKSRRSAADAGAGKAGKAVSASQIGDLAMARYDRALSTLSEAEERARKLVEDNATALSKAHSARFESATKPLGVAHSYIILQLLSLRVSRDEALLSSTLAKLKHREAKAAQTKRAKQSPGAANEVTEAICRRRVKTYPVLVKLLDTMLQSLEQIRELDIVEEDSADLASHVDAKIAFEKARRCATG